MLVGAVWGVALLPQASTTSVRIAKARSDHRSLEASNIAPSSLLLTSLSTGASIVPSWKEVKTLTRRAPQSASLLRPVRTVEAGGVFSV